MSNISCQHPSSTCHTTSEIQSWCASSGCPCCSAHHAEQVPLALFACQQAATTERRTWLRWETREKVQCMSGVLVLHNDIQSLRWEAQWLRSLGNMWDNRRSQVGWTQALHATKLHSIQNISFHTQNRSKQPPAQMLAWHRCQILWTLKVQCYLIT